MSETVRIGTAAVVLDNPEALPDALTGLRRSPLEQMPEERSVHLRVSHCAAREWEPDVAAQDGVHRFGRLSYMLEVAPESMQLHFTFCQAPDANERYWLQRDVFGVLACLSGQLMLHASAVAGPDGRAAVFCGPSGVGKSTAARMMQESGCRPLNDEVNWLFFREGELRIVDQGYWFGGAENEDLAVGRIFLLKQSGRCEILAPPDKAMLFANLLAAHLSIDTEFGFLRARAEALRDFIETYPVQTLAFNLDREQLMGVLWTGNA